MPVAAPNSLYDYPRYYDLVFGSDWKAEFVFLLAAFDTYVPGKVRRVFEPACGTGRLLINLAKAGYEVSGLDLNPRAVDFCNKRFRRHGFPATAQVGDMAAFELPRPVDAAFNMINSFRHLLSEAAARSHLQCIARVLRRGGIYVLGIHLTPTEGNPVSEERWASRRGHLGITTHLQTYDLNLDLRTERCHMVMDVYTPTRCFQIVDDLVFRTYTWRQIRDLLTHVPELTLAATYDFRYRLDRPKAIRADTQDVVLILQKL